MTASAAFLVCVYTVNTVSGQRVEELPPTPAVSERQGSRYLVRAYNGKIAFFTDGAVIETDIDVSSLRAYDRQLLENGIEAYTYEEVLQLLEDFSS